MSTNKKIIPNPYEEVADFKDGMFRFNFADCKTWLEKQGKLKFGQHFHVADSDVSLVHDLMVYAIGDKNTALRRGLDLRKGILLSGPVGCGKTSLMALVNYFFPKAKQYRIQSARNISFEFEKEGFKVIQRYVKGDVPLGLVHSYPVFCFDDLGVEQVQKHYGNPCDVMGEILLSRYDLFVSRNLLTHLTTNLSASEIEDRYGNRVRSRMREMFNLVAFDKESKDKRM